MTSPLRPGRGGLLLAVRVTPKSSRDVVAGLHTDAAGHVSLAVRVTAPPDKGKANKAVIETIAKAAGLPKSSLSLVAGETDRNKTLLVTGNPAGLEALIAGIVNAGKEN
ncbi:MAG TPA: DUF167 family protein [Aestuariivirga sp.]|nr:DUF167 domain-containing protein [Alphaproteobacteria bacterium]HRX35669.1 DUF167 family protein [Aestuariivirga sp.]